MKEIKKSLVLTEHQYDVLKTLLKNYIYCNVRNTNPKDEALVVRTYLTSAESASDCINILEQLEK